MHNSPYGLAEAAQGRGPVASCAEKPDGKWACTPCMPPVGSHGQSKACSAGAKTQVPPAYGRATGGDVRARSPAALGGAEPPRAGGVVHRDRAAAHARERIPPRGPQRPPVQHAHRGATRDPRRVPPAPRGRPTPTARHVMPGAVRPRHASHGAAGRVPAWLHRGSALVRGGECGSAPGAACTTDAAASPEASPASGACAHRFISAPAPPTTHPLWVRRYAPPDENP